MANCTFQYDNIALFTSLAIMGVSLYRLRYLHSQNLPVMPFKQVHDKSSGGFVEQLPPFRQGASSHLVIAEIRNNRPYIHSAISPRR